MFAKVNPATRKLSTKGAIYRGSGTVATVEGCVTTFPPGPIHTLLLRAPVFTALSYVYISPLMALMVASFTVFDNLFIPC